MAHKDGESEIIPPPTGVEAGLEEIGKHGLLVTEGEGSRVRLSGVTTDAPLNPRKESVVVAKGLEDFCNHCGRCAELRPTGAIDPGAIPFGPVNHEKGFETLKVFSTN